MSETTGKEKPFAYKETADDEREAAKVLAKDH